MVFDALVDAVRRRGGELAGLGARDTLRTEMGYPLHGHELSLDISPLQARCGWAIGWKQGRVLGPRRAARREGGRPDAGCCAGCGPSGAVCCGRDLTVLDGDTPVGVTTSGTFSPTLKVGIALALIDTDADIADGQRGRRSTSAAGRSSARWSSRRSSTSAKTR